VSVAATDFTGDGILDIEVVYWKSATIGIIAGNGDGTFGDGTPSAWTMLPTSTQPFSVIAADVNGDGQMDLVVRYQFKTFVSVLLNNGTGTFMPRASYTIGGVATSLLVVDVTGDGKPDLVTANGDVGSVSVLRNQGNGKFAAKVDYVTGAGPFVRAVDLNGDEKVDLVTRNDSSQSVSVLLNLGDGTFTTKVDYPLVLLTPRLGPASFELADVNHDGKVDLVVSGVIDDPMFTRAVSVYLNTGGGVFAWEQNLQVLSDARALAVQDFNGDGNLDVAVEETDENAVTLWLGNGDGTFHNQLSYATLSESPLMLTADADGDGRPDLIVPGAPVTALINGLRGLAIQEQPSVVIPGEAFAVKVGVVNANGELLAGDHSSVTLEIASGPAGAVLGGTVTADVVGGVATFSDLVLAVAGRYSLRALSGSLRPATSAGLVVNAHRELHPTVAVAARGIVTENRMGVELSVLGADVAGEAVLTYRWAETGHSNSGPAPLFGEENGTNAAKNLEANVGVVGWHTFQVVIENGEGLIATVW